MRLRVTLLRLAVAASSPPSCSARSPSRIRQAAGGVDQRSRPPRGHLVRPDVTGLVVPVLKDAGRVEAGSARPRSQAASVADLRRDRALMAGCSTTSESSTGEQAPALGLFARCWWPRGPRRCPWCRQSKRLDMTLTRLQDTTAEIRVRGAVASSLVGFVALAAKRRAREHPWCVHGRGGGGHRRQELRVSTRIRGSSSRRSATGS